MPGNNANKKITESQQETQNPTQETDGIQQVQADGQQTAPAFTPSDSVKTKLSSMTTEEKVAQLFITRPEEITGVSQFTQAGNKTKAAIGTYPLGGFVFRQENFSGEAAVTKMMSSLQPFSQERLGVNLFLAIDEEGGERLPLASANGYEAQQAPSQLGDADSLPNAYVSLSALSPYAISAVGPKFILRPLVAIYEPIFPALLPAASASPSCDEQSAVIFAGATGRESVSCN